MSHSRQSRKGRTTVAFPVLLVTVIGMVGMQDPARGQTGDQSTGWTSLCKSICDFGVLAGGDAETNCANLQKAIDWAAPHGAALFVPPTSDPYRVSGGLVLRRNVSLVGVHGPVGRGKRHPDKPQPVGSVFAIEDGKSRIVDSDGCMECGACARNCPAAAITVRPGVGCTAAVLFGSVGGERGCCGKSSACAR